MDSASRAHTTPDSTSVAMNALRPIQILSINDDTTIDENNVRSSYIKNKKSRELSELT